MQRFIAFVILLALAVLFTPWLQPGVNAASSHKAVFVVGGYTYDSDGQKETMDAAPFILNDRTFVPVRYLGYALGVKDDGITWDQAARKVTLSADGAEVGLSIGSSSLLVNGQERAMDVSPVLKGDRVYLPARWVAEALGYEVRWDEKTKAVLAGPPGNLPEPPAAAASDLPVVGSYENFQKLLDRARQANAYGFGGGGGAVMKSFESTRAAAPESAQGAAADSSLGSADYSRTNVQVGGVDEADIVKTDGAYIYQVNRDRVVISKAYPAEEMNVVSILDFREKSFSPQEMYVDDRYLVVIGQNNRYREYPVMKPMLEESAKMMPGIIPPYDPDTVKAIVFDIGDKSAVKQVRELELNGRYVSSRKIGSAFYLVANKNIGYYPPMEAGGFKPAYRDTAVSNGFVEIDYPQIRYFPGFYEPTYLMVAGMNLDRLQEEARVSTYLGSGENIYASTDNLYVAVTDYQYRILEDAPRLLPEPLPGNQNRTRIHKFALNGGQLTYQDSGEVPGTILNQFSMDEHDGYFRVATTTGDMWRSDQYTSKNNIYVLDSGLNTVGKVEDIAPGEKIYSTRFVGDRGYMVTFKTVDPFFVIDLKDPRQPAILGALKIPGYSDYLQPYDENHIIGFGKDTVEIGQKDPGGGTGSMAFYTGMKVALFDVTDVSRPVEMFKEKIGDRGTDSELLRNHKALLFSKEKNLLAFPVTVLEVEGDTLKPGASVPEYGRFAFQGAYVYRVDLDNGFDLKAKITHLSQEDYLKAGNYWYDGEKNVERILYINDSLYTLSAKMIKANSLVDLNEIKTLEIK